MTDIALDEKALEAAKLSAFDQMEKDNSGFVGFNDEVVNNAFGAAIRAYLCASPSQVAPANPATRCSTTFKNPTKETDMTKLTSKIALELVTRIETLNDQIHAVYREASEYDGINNINVIRDIVKAREEAADQKCVSDGLLEALDLDEDEE